MGQQGRERDVVAMAGRANDRAEQHREVDGRQGARACERFTSALAGRPAPGQAQSAFASPASHLTTTAGPVRPSVSDIHMRPDSACRCGAFHSRLRPSPTSPGGRQGERPGSGLPAGPGDQSGLRASSASAPSALAASSWRSCSRAICASCSSCSTASIASTRCRHCWMAGSTSSSRRAISSSP